MKIAFNFRLSISLYYLSLVENRLFLVLTFLQCSFFPFNFSIHTVAILFRSDFI